MITNISQEIKDYLEQNQTFLILTHKKPDGDAIGSTIALGKGLKSIGKTVDYYIDMPIEKKLDAFHEIVYFDTHIFKEYDAVIMLDCSTYAYAFKPEPMVRFEKMLVIDHHQSNENFGDFNHVEVASATGELIFRLLKQMSIVLDDEMIDAIYTSISTDTGSFQFSNVTSQTHEILSQLYYCKNSFAPLSKKLHHEKSFDQMKMFGEAISSISLFENGRIAWIYLDQQTINQYGGMINITDDIANIGANITGVIIGVTIKQAEDNIYRVSLRSRSPYDIDVSHIAKEHGGGGHQRAAGFSYSGLLSDLKIEIIKFLKEEYELCD